MDMPELFSFLLTCWPGKRDWRQGKRQRVCVPVKVTEGCRPNTNSGHVCIRQSSQTPLQSTVERGTGVTPELESANPNL